MSPGLVRRYAELDGPVISLAGEYLPTLREAVTAPGRLWIVIPSGRSGKPEDLRRWLARHCTQELLVKKQRFDYYDYIVEVFLSGTAQDRAATVN